MLLNRIFEKKYSRLVFVLILLCLGIFIFGFPSYNLGFGVDDLVSLFHSRIQNWSDFFKNWSFKSFLYMGDDSFYEIIGTVNYVVPAGCSYRPILHTLFGLEHFVFGMNPFFYTLLNAIIHSINSVLFFYILIWFFSDIWSFVGALLFLFNASFRSRMILNSYELTDFFSLFCLLILIIFYKKFLESDKFYIYYIFSFIFFFLGLFTRDVFLFVPFILLMATYFYFGNRWNFNYQSFFISVKNVIPFFTLSCFYIIILFYRTSFFGIKGHFFKHTIECYGQWKVFLWSFFSLINDLLGFSFLMNLKTRYIVLSCLIIITGLLFIFFKDKNKNGIFICALICSVYLISWPIFFIGYGVRYVYPAIPFFILMLILIFYHSIILNKIIFFIYAVIVISSGIFFYDKKFVITNLYSVVFLQNKVTKNFVKEFYLNKNTEADVLFLSVPALFASCALQSVSLYSGSKKIKVYTLGYLKNVSNKNHNLELEIQPVKNGYRCKLNEASKMYFYDINIDYYKNRLGNIFVNKKNKNNEIKDFTIIFDENFTKEHKNLKVYSWDFVNNKFCLLPTLARDL